MARPLVFKNGTQQMQIRVPQEHYAAMKDIQEREGIPMAAQLRLALEAWISTRGKGKR